MVKTKRIAEAKIAFRELEAVEKFLEKLDGISENDEFEQKKAKLEARISELFAADSSEYEWYVTIANIAGYMEVTGKIDIMSDSELTAAIRETIDAYDAKFASAAPEDKLPDIHELAQEMLLNKFAAKVDEKPFAFSDYLKNSLRVKAALIAGRMDKAGHITIDEDNDGAEFALEHVIDEAIAQHEANNPDSKNWRGPYFVEIVEELLRKTFNPVKRLEETGIFVQDK
jgi:hypothetical protein